MREGRKREEWEREEKGDKRTLFLSLEEEKEERKREEWEREEWEREEWEGEKEKEEGEICECIRAIPFEKFSLSCISSWLSSLSSFFPPPSSKEKRRNRGREGEREEREKGCRLCSPGGGGEGRIGMGVVIQALKDSLVLREAIRREEGEGEGEGEEGERGGWDVVYSVLKRICFSSLSHSSTYFFFFCDFKFYYNN